jgi:hypothetical protein
MLHMTVSPGSMMPDSTSPTPMPASKRPVTESYIHVSPQQRSAAVPCPSGSYLVTDDSEELSVLVVCSSGRHLNLNNQSARNRHEKGC